MEERVHFTSQFKATVQLWEVKRGVFEAVVTLLLK